MIYINCIIYKLEFKHALSLLADVLKPFLQKKKKKIAVDLFVDCLETAGQLS